MARLQLELPLSFPPLPEDVPLVPLRMLNEYVYCPRLAYLEWVQGEFAHNADTLDGARVHRRADERGDDVLPEATSDEKSPDSLTLRSVWLSSRRLGLTGKIDVLDVDGDLATPVEYKRGKRPHVPKGAYEPELVQLCAQGLLLREHGYRCEEGFIWFAGSRERVRVSFDEELINRTLQAASELRGMVLGSVVPPPLVDSPKCPRCSLIGICLPDEVNHLRGRARSVRPAYASAEHASPLYVQDPQAYLRKDGERVIIEVDKEKRAEARLGEVSQIALFGHARISTPLLGECMRRGIPVSFFTYGGWFLGHVVGLGHGNVEARKAQFRKADDALCRLRLARSLVEAKIANARTLLRRNWRADADELKKVLASLSHWMKRARTAKELDALLGIEGSAANLYFRHFTKMLRSEDSILRSFSFEQRNRRPPRDPINAMLSFGYALLAKQWTIALSAVGLDPYCGFYHASRFGRPSLALDLMEPFRPLIVDSVVVKVINNGEVKGEDFLVGHQACAMKKKARQAFLRAFDRRLAEEITHPVFGYRISYRRLFEVQARLFARWLLGEFDEYPQIRTR